MKTTLIKKLKLALAVVVIADIFTLVFEYRIIYLGVYVPGGAIYNLIGLVLKSIH